MRGTNALIPHAMPSTLTSTHQRQSFGSYSQSWVWPPGPMPALLHRTCTAPYSPTVCSARCSSDSGLVTSVTQPADGRGPRPGARPRRRRAARAGCRPASPSSRARAKWRPIASPMPFAPPVTTATLSSTLRIVRDYRPHDHRDRGDTMTVRYGARQPEAAAQPRGRGDLGADLVDRGDRGLGDRSRRHPRRCCRHRSSRREPLARIRFATVNMGTGIPIFGAGLVRRARPARHAGGRVRAVHADDHRAGDDRRARDLRRAEEDRRGRDRRRRRPGARAHRAHGLPARRGPRHARRAGRHRAARQDRLLLQAQPVAGRQGLRHRARARARATGTRKRATAATIDGTLALHDSPIDPIADIPVDKLVSLQFAQVATTQHGEVVERVPADWLLPFVHQRYDDLSVLGKKD